MKENNIDEFLRENKPRVKDAPAFIPATVEKMAALEGIKDEVDRGRRTGLLAIVVALIIGLAAGVAASAFILLAPKLSIQSPDAIFTCIVNFLQTWKYLIYGLTVVCAIVLGLVLQGRFRYFHIPIF